MMFEKIMPALAGNPFSSLAPTPAATQSQPEAQPSEISALRSRIGAVRSIVPNEHPMPHNVTELAVDAVIDSVIRKFNCCPCNRCRKDIAAFALNMLPPQYSSGTQEEIEALAQQIDHKEVYNALIKAVLYVRSHPNH